MAPAAAGLVDESDEDLLLKMGRQVDCHTLEALRVVAGDALDDGARVLADDFHACRRLRPAGDEEAAPRLGDLEGNRRERPLRCVARDLERSDPVASGVLTPHIT